MYIRTAIAAVAMSFAVSVTPASAHYSGCSDLQNIWSNGFCKTAHNIRHHSAQARNQGPWSPPVGSYGNPYDPYWRGNYWPAQYPTYPTYPTYPGNVYPTWPVSGCGTIPTTTFCPY